MDKEQLKELREIFRARMRERDFCIGEKEVEELFCELLEESTERMYAFGAGGKHFSPEHTAAVLRAELELIKPRIQKLFERDDIFFKTIK